MAGDEFVWGDDAHEVAVIAAHGGDFVVVGHGVGGVGDAHGGLSVDGVGHGFLAVWRDHFETPDFFGEWGDGDEIVLFEEVDGAVGFGDGEGWLAAWGDVGEFDFFDGSFGGGAHGGGGGGELGFAPCELAVGDFDEFLWGVGDHFVGEACGEGGGADGVADERVIGVAFL